MTDGAAEKCRACEYPLVAITMMVDGNELRMHSCDNCDTRSWNLGGAPIDLELVLQQVGEHSGRRR